MNSVGDEDTTHSCFDDSTGRRFGLLPVLRHPVQLDVECLLAQAFRQEIVGKVLDDLL